MLLFQKVVSGDTKYDFVNESNMVTFEIHNDSPYSVGVKFGTDVGYANADYFLLPHQHMYGINPIGIASFSVGGATYNGTVFIYTRTPQGGGPINLTSVPASEISIIGYPANTAPAGTTSLARMTTVPNQVNNVSGSAASVQNDGNPAGTSVVEATQLSSPSSNITILNDGTVIILQFVAGVATELLHIRPGNSTPVTIGAANTVTELLGGLLTDQNIHTNGALAVDGTSLLSGLVTAAAGLTISGGSLTLPTGSLTRLVKQQAKSFASGTTTYTHGLGFQPDFVNIMSTDGAAISWGWEFPSSTTINIINGSGSTHSCDLYFFKS